MRESRRELGMRELEGSFSRGPRKLASTGNSGQGKGTVAPYGSLSGEAQLPERRGRKPHFQQMRMEEPDEEAPANARGNTGEKRGE